jgi:hypothetical protein
MRRVGFVIVLILLAAPHVFSSSQDTIVFNTRMLPDNEVPSIAAAGNSANATITVHVTRDEKANVNAATVTFDINYTITSALTFTGLHIHNGPAGQNGPVVIDTGISGTNSVNAAPGSGKITRVINYASTDNALKFVTGLLATPENYYVNIHTTVNPGGFMRGQFQSSHLIFRPVMSSVFEVPAVNLDAEGAALVDVEVNRDPQTGTITSGTVIFDVDYRFPNPVTITGLHIHNGPFGVNAPVVIDTGTNATSTAVTAATRGNIFRVVDIPSSNTAGIAALNGLFTDPTQYYINMHTTDNPGGVIRGQLSKNVFVFYNHMIQDEENPPTGVSGDANSMTYVRIDRDSTGNVVGGAVSFNVNYVMGGPQTFIGLHIHNGKIGANGPVVINTGISGSNPIMTTTGGGSINKEIEIRPGDGAFDFMRGLVENPENYYVNIHTTQFPGGVIRAQLARETYHYKASMSPANEVPPVTGADTTATGWITAKISRDANGVLNGGAVTFDVNYTGSGPVSFVGLHIHYPGTAGVNAPVIINTGLNGTNTVDSATGSGNITRVVPVDSSSSIGLTTLNSLITVPDTAYVNIHTTQNPGGVARSQMFPVVNTVAQLAGGGDWASMITIQNSSATSSVMGILDLFQSNGSLLPEAISHPNIWFLIPPSGSVTINTHNKGNLTGGFAKVFSNGAVTVTSRFTNPNFTSDNSTGTTVTAQSVSIPVAVSDQPIRNTAVSIIANSAGTLNLSLRNASGTIIPGGSATINVTAGQEISSYVTQLLPANQTGPRYTGTLTITASSGTISVLALQFDGTNPGPLAMSPVVVTALQ